jgi:MFS family permease
MSVISSARWLAAAASSQGKAAISGLPRAYWILWFATLVNRLGTFVVPFLYLYLTRSEHMSVAQASLVVALYGLGSTFSGPVGGLLADRLGRRRTMISGLAVGALLMVALGVTHVTAFIPLLAFALGFAGELHRPAASAMIADLVAPAGRVRAYGMLHWAVNLGFVVGLLLAGVMAERDFFLFLFLGDAATSLLCAAIVWRWLPESRPRRTEWREPVLSTLWAPLRDRRFAVVCLLALLTAMIYFQFATTLPEALARRGISPAEYGALVAMTCVVVTLVQPFATPLLERAHRGHVLAAACTLIAVGFGSVALFSSLPLFMLSGLIWTLGEIAYAAIMPTMVAGLAPPERRAGYHGSYQMARGLASFAGPALGGLVLQHLGPEWLWAGCFVLGLVLAFGHHAIARPGDHPVGKESQ